MDYREAAALLRAQDQILIITHRRPDGDTIGSGAALCHALRSLGKTAHLHPNEEVHDLFAPYTAGLDAPAGFSPAFIVAVDTASWDLIPESAQRLYGSAVDLCIDHHGSNEFFAKETYLAPEHAACGELVYLLILELCPISPQIALLLYLAISTDTGCFVFSNTTALTHRITAELMEYDFDYRAINKRHFRTKSLPRLHMESQMIQNMQMLHGGITALVSIPLASMKAAGATEDDMDNISSFLEQIEGVQIAVTIRELSAAECKISLRTGGQYDASAICALLGGGGHPAAAGCSVYGNFEAAQSAIIEAIETVQTATQPSGG